MNPLWDKAAEAADEARALVRLDMPNGATSRAYYAAFTAARALLVDLTGFEEADLRRHAAVHKLFSEHVIKPGLLAADLGRELRKLFAERARADYTGSMVSLERAKKALDFMEQFLEAAAAVRAGPR
jgi:uncharacterized protein (UPF0332 family)